MQKQRSGDLSQKSELENNYKQPDRSSYRYSFTDILYISLSTDLSDRSHIANSPLLSSLLQNFLDNFPSGDVMVFVARTFLLFQMITVYPLLGYLVRVQIMGQIFGNHYPR